MEQSRVNRMDSTAGTVASQLATTAQAPLQTLSSEDQSSSESDSCPAFAFNKGAFTKKYGPTAGVTTRKTKQKKSVDKKRKNRVKGMK